MSVAPRIKAWTLEELHRLPDDGNKYELVRGELFVTPAPSPRHQRIIATLNAILLPYVVAQRLGQVHQPRAIVRRAGGEVEPDLFVGTIADRWEESPPPILVVEVLSASTRRRDLEQKRAFYLDGVRVPEYWMVDPEVRALRVAHRARGDRIVGDTMTWQPDGASRPLEFDVSKLFV